MAWQEYRILQLSIQDTRATSQKNGTENFKNYLWRSNSQKVRIIHHYTLRNSIQMSRVSRPSFGLNYCIGFHCRFNLCLRFEFCPAQNQLPTGAWKEQTIFMDSSKGSYESCQCSSDSCILNYLRVQLMRNLHLKYGDSALNTEMQGVKAYPLI